MLLKPHFLHSHFFSTIVLAYQCFNLFNMSYSLFSQLNFQSHLIVERLYLTQSFLLNIIVAVYSSFLFLDVNDRMIRVVLCELYMTPIFTSSLTEYLLFIHIRISVSYRFIILTCYSLEICAFDYCLQSSHLQRSSVSVQNHGVIQV